MVGLAYLNTLPPEIVAVADRIFCVFTAFLDMGTAFGIAGLFVFFAVKRSSGQAVKRIRALKSVAKLEELMSLALKKIGTIICRHKSKSI